MKLAYIGCRTTRERNARGMGLKTYRIDEHNGIWHPIQLLETQPNPSYQTLDLTGNFLYSVHGDTSKVSAYKILTDGSLEEINSIDIGGRNPVFLVINSTNRYLVVATLQGGAIYSIQRHEDGSLGEIVDTQSYEGKIAEDNSFVHQVIWDQSKQYIFAPAQGRIKGYGQLRVFRFDNQTGKLTQTCQIFAREFAEPRHVAIHPSNRFVYLLNEKDSTICFCEFDAATGVLTPRQILSMLPETYTGEGQASAVIVDSTGNFLLGSNRIHDSIVVYKIDQHTGYLHLSSFTDSLGKTPRFISFDHDTGYLYVANEDSDTIVEMELDLNHGSLKTTGNVIHTESPVCITFLTKKEGS